MWKSWLVVLAACGGGGGNPPATDADATADAPADAEADATPDAQDLTRVDVIVTDRTGDGAPDATASVICSDPSGALVHDGPTDAQGRAHCSLPGGGTVTVVQRSSSSNNVFHTLTTFRGVRPLDALRAGRPQDPTRFRGAQDVMTASVTLPGPPLNAGQFVTACGGGSLQSGIVTFTFFDSCRTPTFDVLALHQDPAGLMTYVWQPDVPHVADDMFAIPDAWQLVAPTNLTFTNVPANTAGVGFTQTVMVGAFPVGLDSATREFPPAGTVVFPMRHASTAGRARVITAGVSRGLFQRGDSMAMVTLDSPANPTIDLAAQPIPFVDDPPLQTQTNVSWVEVGTGTGAPDARLVTWIGKWTTATEEHSAIWQIIEDPTDGQTSSSLPGLPAAHAAEDPTVAAGVFLDGAVVQYLDYDNLAGYDAARPHGPLLELQASQFLDVAHRSRVTVSRCRRASGGPPC